MQDNYLAEANALEQELIEQSNIAAWYYYRCKNCYYFDPRMKICDREHDPTDPESQACGLFEEI